MVKNILDYFKRKNKERLYKQWVKKGDLPIEEVPPDLLKNESHQEDGLPEDVTYEQVTEHTTTIDIDEGMIHLPVRYVFIGLSIIVFLLVAFSVVLTILITRT
jgi:hypothetical protein